MPQEQQEQEQQEQDQREEQEQQEEEEQEQEQQQEEDEPLEEEEGEQQEEDEDEQQEEEEEQQQQEEEKDEQERYAGRVCRYVLACWQVIAPIPIILAITVTGVFVLNLDNWRQCGEPLDANLKLELREQALAMACVGYVVFFDLQFRLIPCGPTVRCTIHLLLCSYLLYNFWTLLDTAMNIYSEHLSHHAAKIYSDHLSPHKAPLCLRNLLVEDIAQRRV